MDYENKNNTYTEEVCVCAWCGEEWPISECRMEVQMGHLCPYCQNELRSRGEKAVYEE